MDILIRDIAGGVSNLYQAAKGNPYNFWIGKPVAPGTSRFFPRGEIGTGDPILRWPSGRIVDARTGQILYEEPSVANVKVLDAGSQAKHLPGSKGYMPGRGTIDISPYTILDDVRYGNFQFVAPHTNGAILKMPYTVGEAVVLPTSVGQPTLMGPTPYVMMHVRANGAVHFVPHWFNSGFVPPPPPMP